MTLRDHIEHHPLIIVGTFFLGGFAACYTAYEVFLQKTDRTIVLKSELDAAKEGAKRASHFEELAKSREQENEILRRKLDAATETTIRQKAELNAKAA